MTLSGHGTVICDPSSCLLSTVPTPSGWQLEDITITTLRSIQALADTFPFWTVNDSPLQSNVSVYHYCLYICHVYIITCCIYTHTETYILINVHSNIHLAYVCHNYRFFSLTFFKTAGNPLRSFRAVSYAKIPSQSKSWSSCSLVKKLSKNT